MIRAFVANGPADAYAGALETAKRLKDEASDALMETRARLNRPELVTDLPALLALNPNCRRSPACSRGTTIFAGLTPSTSRGMRSPRRSSRGLLDVRIGARLERIVEDARRAPR